MCLCVHLCLIRLFDVKFSHKRFGQKKISSAVAVASLLSSVVKLRIETQTTLAAGLRPIRILQAATM